MSGCLKLAAVSQRESGCRPDLMPVGVTEDGDRKNSHVRLLLVAEEQCL
jgi:hypothetical protein